MQSNTKIRLIATSCVALVIITVAFPVVSLFAVSETELRSKTDTLQEKIDKNMQIVEDLEHKGNTLKDRIAQLRAEVEVANQQIEIINLKIQTLEKEVAAAEKELVRQKNLLNNSLRTLYKQGNVTTIELLASSGSYSEYVNQQEYLERLKNGIQQSANKVEELKDQLIKDKQKQEDLLSKQQAQRDILEEKKQEQNDILAKTQGQESKYRKIVENLEQQRQQAEDELKSYLASLIKENYTSLGYVTQGTRIGLVGSSGFSTGPHMHFAITDGVSFFDPGTYGALNYGMSWPLPNSDASNISQGFGCVAPADWYLTKCNGGANSFHSGLDIAGWYGDPVVAARDGDIIFRGTFGGYGNTVIIDHGDGIYSYYPHLLQ